MSASLNAVPTELRERPQWVLWRYEERNGKMTKVPRYAAAPWREASSTDASTWASFERAIGKLYEPGIGGLGFVFSPDDPYVGIDLDDCLSEDGEIEPWAAEIVEGLNSYTERTPSGCGLHIVIKGELTGPRRRTGSFEVYDQGRYFTMTGERIGDHEEIEERQDQLDALCERMFPPPSPPGEPTGEGLATPDDRELLERVFAAKNGAKTESLFHGELNGHGSHSEADLALCSALAFWTGPDPARLDRLFRSSALMREKWDSPRGESSYGAQTIEKAFNRSEFYEARTQAPPKAAEPPAEGGDDPEAKEQLGELLGLSSVGLQIVGARIVGKGAKASADLYLSDGTEVNFETLRDFATHRTLGIEIAAATGARPTLKAQQALEAVVLLRRIAEHREALTRDQAAIEWGLEYLQAAVPIAVDMKDGADRWRAFTELRDIDPYSTHRETGVSLAAAGRALVHTDGTRYVRTGWFVDHVRRMDIGAGSNSEIDERMERVGWRRTGATGRVKATQPGFARTLGWNFFMVPAGWEDAP